MLFQCRQTARILVLIVFFNLVIQTVFSNDIVIESHMDWATGLLEIQASRPLGSGFSPSDHPVALAALERDFSPVLSDEIGRIVLDNNGTLNRQKLDNSVFGEKIELLTKKMMREWSRISKDRQSIEALYFIDMSRSLPDLIPSAGYGDIPDAPVGWIPIPEDEWTGILVYVPNDLPLRGTGLKVNPVPALRPRLLSQSLQILLDPAKIDGKIPSYLTMDGRDAAEKVVGRRPYRMMARELYGEAPCDIIISNEDEKRLLAAPSGRDALRTGRVVLLLEPSDR